MGHPLGATGGMILGHADRRARAPGQALRPGHAVHRRRHGHRDDRGAHLMSTIKWEQDADGVVVLTLDDPNQSANTMNEAYKASMSATVDRLEAEKDSITGVMMTSAKKTFFAGGDLNDLKKAAQGGRGRGRDHGARAQARPAPAGDAGQAGRRGDQRCGAGRRPGDRTGHALPRDRRRLQGRAGLPGGPARAAPGRRWRDALGAHVRHRQRAAAAAPPGPAPAAGQVAGAGPGRRGRRARGTSSSRRRRSGSPRTPRPSSRGTSRATRSRAARRPRPRWRPTCRRSRRTCARRSRARTIPPRTTSWPRRSRARRSTSTPRSRSRAATSSTS